MACLRIPYQIHIFVERKKERQIKRAMTKKNATEKLAQWSRTAIRQLLLYICKRMQTYYSCAHIYLRGNRIK